MSPEKQKFIYPFSVMKIACKKHRDCFVPSLRSQRRAFEIVFPDCEIESENRALYTKCLPGRAGTFLITVYNGVMKPIGETKSIFRVFIFAAAMVALATCRSSAISGLPPGTDETLRNIQQRMYPPEVHEVTLDPAVPAAGQPITISAKIYNPTDITDDYTTQAWVMYSTDGGASLQTVEMTEGNDSQTWTAELPAFDTGTEAIYGFRAIDTSTNIYTESPCKVASWPPEEDHCMFDIAVDDYPVDDKSSLIPDDFDILGIRAGMDDRYMYIEISVQGIVTPGTVSPVYASVYGFGLLNPDRGDQSDIVTQGFLGVWSPLADTIGYRRCMIIQQTAGDVSFDNKYIRCLTDGESHLWFKFDRKAIGDNPSGHVKLIAADGAFTSFSPAAGVYYDYTNITEFVFLGRRFSVQ
jgi:hypothetical protein